MKRMLNKQFAWRALFGIIIIVMGIVFELKGVGKDFLPTYTLGFWLIFVGFLSFFVGIVHSLRKKRRKIDERIEFIGNKASRITFLILIFGAFLIMIVDGIKHISMRYSLFMAYLICGVMIIYFLAYKFLERKN